MATTPAVRTLTLRKGRDRALRQRHPWIFSGAVAQLDDAAASDDDIVDVRSAEGAWLGRAYVNERSQIVARVLTFEDEPVDRAFFAGRVDEALAWRARVPGAGETSALRLVNAEGDGLPGLVVDRYGDVLVVQVLSAGMERRKAWLAELLAERCAAHGLSARCVYERSDVDVRKKEGLSEHTGVLLGPPPPAQVEIEEHGRRFLVDVLRGHKTGFYVDQRENRALVGRLAQGADVLNAFSYTGGFGIYAATAGARSVVQLDASEPALELAEEHARRNGVPGDRLEHACGDAFYVLRRFRDEGRSFDLVVLDPPKLAKGKKNVDAACRGYKDLNLLALKLLRPGGLLLTFSCSGSVSKDLFQKVVFGASVDAARDVEVLAHLEAGLDHPARLAFAEGSYLKGLLGRVS